MLRKRNGCFESEEVIQIGTLETKQPTPRNLNDARITRAKNP
ncbi:hypothetical protein [Burkholderia ubonensis]|nr:hypothetical protein [Burkholderia ubonensis]